MSYQLRTHICNRIEYQKKKGKAMTIEFVKDEAALAKLNSKEALFKKNVTYCPAGLPASSGMFKKKRRKEKKN